MINSSLVLNKRRKWRIFFLNHIVFVLFLCGVIPLAFADTPTAPQFQSGDRVGFIGDSITDIGIYHSYLQLFYATRFPDRKIQYFSAGHSGGSANDCLSRLDWDILARSPNIATVNFGMNDMYGTFGAPQASSVEVEKGIEERMKPVQESYEKLLDALTSAGVRLVLVGPSIYDDTVQLDTPVQRSNKALTLWTQRIKAIAERRKVGFVDLGSKMNEVNARLQAGDPKGTIVGRDRVHPAESGNLVMVYSILRAQGIGPDVAKISLDAAKGEAGNLINCTVEEIERRGNGIAFMCQEKALPFPTPYQAEKGLELIAFTEELNRETLVVGNLPAGKYDLHIDEAVVGQYDAKDLSGGINLALNSKTPQYLQSQKLLKDNDQRHKLEKQLRYLPFLRHSRPARQNLDWNDSAVVEKFLREEIVKLKPDDWFRHVAEAYLKEVLGKTEAIKEQVQELKSKMEKERTPQAHKFALVRVN